MDILFIIFAVLATLLSLCLQYRWGQIAQRNISSWCKSNGYKILEINEDSFNKKGLKPRLLTLQKVYYARLSDPEGKKIRAWFRCGSKNYFIGPTNDDLEIKLEVEA